MFPAPTSQTDQPIAPESLSTLAVVIPCFRVRQHLLEVVAGIGTEVERIYCVIDGCREGSRSAAEQAALKDPRIQILLHEQNQGVGAATISGIRQALSDGADIIVKLDGDGQMDPALIPYLVQPVMLGLADYAKGNRFGDLSDVRSMPWVRLLGNAGLSFFAKLSTGYWNLFDPTNGFVAIHADIARRMPWDKIQSGYFFESDVLFRLNTLRAKVIDRPMKAKYGSEQSGLSPLKAAVQFPFFHARNFGKRLFYTYFLHNFHMASLNLVLGVLLIVFGCLFGGYHWWQSIQTDQAASAGTVMLAALPLVMGWQSLLSFFTFDVGNVPRVPAHFDK